MEKKIRKEKVRGGERRWEGEGRRGEEKGREGEEGKGLKQISFHDSAYQNEQLTIFLPHSESRKASP